MKKKVVMAIVAMTLISMLVAFDGNCGNYGRSGRFENRGWRNGAEIGHPRHFENREHNFMEELELSDDQMEKLEEMRYDHQKEMIELHSRIKIMELEEREAMKDHDFEKAKNTAEKISEIKTELAKSKIDMMKKRWEMLTPEQKEKAEESMKNRKFFQHHSPQKSGMSKKKM